MSTSIRSRWAPAFQSVLPLGLACCGSPSPAAATAAPADTVADTPPETVAEPDATAIPETDDTGPVDTKPTDAAGG